MRLFFEKIVGSLTPSLLLSAKSHAAPSLLSLQRSGLLTTFGESLSLSKRICLYLLQVNKGRNLELKKSQSKFRPFSMCNS